MDRFLLIFVSILLKTLFLYLIILFKLSLLASSLILIIHFLHIL